jgi:hypothetical protein
MSWVKRAQEEVIYIGVFLDEASRGELVSWWETVTNTPMLSSVKADHMTLSFHPEPAKVEALRQHLGLDVSLTITGWAENNRIQAVSIDDGFSSLLPLGTIIPMTPHITVAHQPGVPPKESAALIIRGVNAVAGPTLHGKLGLFTSAGIQVEASEGAILYVDLDGVLVDFAGGFQSKTGQTVDEYSKTQPFYKAIQNDQAFWEDLEWLPGAQDFWNSVTQYNPTILSGPLRDETSKTGKRVWVEKNLGPNVSVILESHKVKYARPGAVLVDDREKEVVPWGEAGGTAILHGGDYGETLKQVQAAMQGKDAAPQAEMTPEWETLIASIEKHIKDSPGFSWKVLYDALGGTDEEREGGTYIEWLLKNIDPGEVRGYLNYEFGGLPRKKGTSWVVTASPRFKIFEPLSPSQLQEGDRIRITRRYPIITPDQISYDTGEQWWTWDAGDFSNQDALLSGHVWMVESVGANEPNRYILTGMNQHIKVNLQLFNDDGTPHSLDGVFEVIKGDA